MCPTYGFHFTIICLGELLVLLTEKIAKKLGNLDLILFKRVERVLSYFLVFVIELLFLPAQAICTTPGTSYSLAFLWSTCKRDVLSSYLVLHWTLLVALSGTHTALRLVDTLA